MKPEHTKPFSLVDAKAGASYAQQNGFAARIGIWDKKGQFPLLGLRDDFHNQEVVGTWRIDGKNLHCPGELDLVMLPLGYCEGKPVFIGDELIWCDQPNGNNIKIDANSPRDFSDCKWPRTAPVMPNMNVTCFETIEKAIHYSRKEIEAYWKALDEYESAK